ncbi:MAG: ice-binding family protein [Gallionella sp.]|nr:ice-binding family protein [Gallionella sp.]
MEKADICGRKVQSQYLSVIRQNPPLHECRRWFWYLNFEIHFSGEAQMNKSENIYKPLVWLMTLLLAAFVVGCGGGGGGSSTTASITGSTTTPGAGTGTGAGRGPAPVVLGGAGNFVILAKSAVSTTGVTAITGNIGLSPAAASFITGFSLIADASNVFSTSSIVTGNVYASDYAVPTPANLTTAVNNMLTAYTDAAGRAPDYTELGAGNIGGLTLAPGTYKWGTGLLIPTNVTLNGGPNDVWIFQVAQGVTVASGAQVILTGGALPKNIFWQSFGAVDIGTTAHMEGVVLSQTSITLRTGASANSRLLAQTAVTLDANAVTQPAP